MHVNFLFSQIFFPHDILVPNQRVHICQTLIFTTCGQRYIQLQALYHKTEILSVEFKDHQEIFQVKTLTLP